MKRKIKKSRINAFEALSVKNMLNIKGGTNVMPLGGGPTGPKGYPPITKEFDDEILS
jgi:hypothetical protein